MTEKAKLVTIKHIVPEERDSDWEGIEIAIDGEVLAEGCYGGEPEDNSRYRDYAWVEEALDAIVTELGGEVEHVEVIAED